MNFLNKRIVSNENFIELLLNGKQICLLKVENHVIEGE